MPVLRSIAEMAGVPGPVFLAIGVFDGVHRGHQALIRRCIANAAASGGTPVVVTFDPHPMKVLQPETAPRLLTSTEHKSALIGALGVGHLLIIPFSLEFAATPPEVFIRNLVSHGHPLAEICVGHTWTFGARRAGNLDLLQQLGHDLGFRTEGIADVTYDGDLVSSTRIRRLISAGDLEGAGRLLDRPYTVLGTVVEGDRLGRTLGFPTANLSAHNELFPPSGVYAIRARRPGGTLGGVANIGRRPTVTTTERPRVLEVHLFDFDEDIYGQDLEIDFVEFLRPEQKFPDLEKLREQIAHDAERARALLG